MKKIIIALIVLSISLFGFTSVKELKFESGISIYGQVGFAHIILEENFSKNTYKMSVKTFSTGIVKALTKNREDMFISEGDIKDGVYIPNKFTKQTSKTDYCKLITYLFDHKNNKVTKDVTIEKNETITIFNPANFELKSSKKLVVEKNSEDIELIQNDFLTLYLNLAHGNLQKGDVAYLDQDEEDSISLIDKGLFEIQKENGEENYQIVLINDENSIFFHKAVAMNIAFYGDAYIKKISEENKVLN
jgi:hypothetical protein